MDRKSIKKTEEFLCSVSLEILEVTSLSARLLRQTSENVFQGKEMRPYTILHYLGGFYINLSLANPIRFPDRTPGDLAVSNISRKIYTNRIWLFSGARSIGSICLNRILTQRLGIESRRLVWWVSVDTSARTQVADPDWYLKILQDEADLGVKEKADKPNISARRSTKGEKMPEAVNSKDSEPSYKRVCCLLMGNTCVVVQRNPLLIF